MCESNYQNYVSWKNWKPESFGKPSLREAIYFQSELACAGYTDLKGLRVLELGFGNGSFAGFATQCGAIYQGTELISELIDRGRQAGFIVHDGAIYPQQSQERECFDLVVAFDVFEHFTIYELKPMFAHLHDLLCAGGRVLARVPSGDSPFARALQHGDPTHRVILGSIMVTNLGRQAGFKEIICRDQALPIVGLGWREAMYRIKVHLFRRVAYPIIRELMGGGRPVLTHNLVFSLVK